MLLALLAASVVTSLFVCSSVQAGSCPSGDWQQLNESCYHFVQQEKTWVDAEVYCIRRGARLVKVETKEENDYLKDYLLSNARYFYGYDMWMGGRRDELGNWEWADTAPILQDTFEDWQPGQPDALAIGQIMCLQFESDYKYRWDDDNCDDLSYSICERPFEPITPPSPVVKSVTEDIIG